MLMHSVSLGVYWQINITKIKPKFIFPTPSQVPAGLQSNMLCLPLAFQEHSGRVFRLQFDEFQIVSSSHDDTILIWDFLNDPAAQAESTRSPSRTYTYISR